MHEFDPSDKPEMGDIPPALPSGEVPHIAHISPDMPEQPNQPNAAERSRPPIVPPPGRGEEQAETKVPETEPPVAHEASPAIGATALGGELPPAITPTEPRYLDVEKFRHQAPVDSIEAAQAAEKFLEAGAKAFTKHADNIERVAAGEVTFERVSLHTLTKEGSNQFAVWRVAQRQPDPLFEPDLPTPEPTSITGIEVVTSPLIGDHIVTRYIAEDNAVANRDMTHEPNAFMAALHVPVVYMNAETSNGELSDAVGTGQQSSYAFERALGLNNVHIGTEQQQAIAEALQTAQPRQESVRSLQENFQRLYESKALGTNNASGEAVEAAQTFIRNIRRYAEQGHPMAYELEDAVVIDPHFDPEPTRASVHVQIHAPEDAAPSAHVTMRQTITAEQAREVYDKTDGLPATTCITFDYIVRDERLVIKASRLPIDEAEMFDDESMLSDQAFARNVDAWRINRFIRSPKVY